MKTYLTTLVVLESIWFIGVFLFGCWGIWLEYQLGKKRKWNYKFSYYINKVILDLNLISAYFVGLFLTFYLAVPITGFVFIFEILSKLWK